MRVKDAKDMFKVCAPILETITFVKDTKRMRSIDPGEEVESMWDMLKGNVNAIQYIPKDGNPREITGRVDPMFIYTEADEAEDAILFPEEKTGAMKDDLYRAKPSLLEKFEVDHTIDMRRFVRDLDSDEELSDNDSWRSHDDHQDAEDIDEEDDEEAWETDEDDLENESDGEFDYSFANPEDVETALEVLEDHFKNKTIYTKGKSQREDQAALIVDPAANPAP